MEYRSFYNLYIKEFPQNHPSSRWIGVVVKMYPNNDGTVGGEVVDMNSTSSSEELENWFNNYSEQNSYPLM